MHFISTTVDLICIFVKIKKIMIIRTKYINNIKNFIDKPLIKVITGIRRSGKSILLMQIKDIIKSKNKKEVQIIYINKELFEFDFIRDYKDLHIYVTSNRKNSVEKTYLFIDEIQEIDEWEKTINSFLAEGLYDIYITGSSAKLLSSNIATLIAGRYIEFKIFTFTFSEYIQIRNQNTPNNNENELFNDFIKYGGFPGLHYLTWEEDILRQYLGAIYNTIVLKDIISKNKIKDVSMLKNILEFISSNCGNITSAKSIADYNKSQKRNISTDTVINYLQFAEDAMLINKVKRYDLIGKKTLETYEKFYLADIGLAYSLLGNNPNLISGKLENIVYLELLSRGYNVNIGKNNSAEIDFIAQKNDEKIYIQVSASILDLQTQNREYNAYKNINDHYPKYVISMDNLNFNTNQQGIKWMNIKDFLLSDNLYF